MVLTSVLSSKRRTKNEPRTKWNYKMNENLRDWSAISKNLTRINYISHLTFSYLHMKLQISVKNDTIHISFFTVQSSNFTSQQNKSVSDWGMRFIFNKLSLYTVSWGWFIPSPKYQKNCPRLDIKNGGSWGCKKARKTQKSICSLKE